MSPNSRRGFAPFLGVLVVGLLGASFGCPSPGSDGGPPIGPLGTGGEWEDKAAMLGPRQETSVLELDGLIYVLGGFVGTTTVATVEVYDPADDTWEAKADMPAALHHLNATVHEGKIYVMGALSGIGFSATGRSMVYDPADDSWTDLEPIPGPFIRGGGFAVSAAGFIWVVGGIRDNSAVAEVHRYDPAADTWERTANLPAERDHLLAGVIDGVIYAAGGRLARIASHAPSLYALDPSGDDAATRAWVEKTPAPTSRAGAGGAVLDGKLYVVGGEGNPDEDTGVFAQVEAYDPVTDSWATLEPMPVPRHGMGAAAFGGVLYVPGGAEVAGLAAVDVHEAFKP